jgi:hypothetical protein
MLLPAIQRGLATEWLDVAPPSGNLTLNEHERGVLKHHLLDY